MENNNEELNSISPENTAAESANGGNFNDNLHGENLTERAKVLSPGKTVAKRFFRSKLSVIGLVMLILLFAISFIGPLFSKWSGNDGKIVDTSTTTTNGMYIELTFTGPDGETYYGYDVSFTHLDYNSLGGVSADHWMGTTIEGYDVFTRLMLGGRVSLTIGFVVVI